LCASASSSASRFTSERACSSSSSSMCHVKPQPVNALGKPQPVNVQGATASAGVCCSRLMLTLWHGTAALAYISSCCVALKLHFIKPNACAAVCSAFMLLPSV
jgi:hypothetical protein